MSIVSHITATYILLALFGVAIKIHSPLAWILCASAMLPDLIRPHYWLYKRHKCCFHSVWALLIVIMCGLIAMLFVPVKYPIILIAGYSTHLILDYFTGGIKAFPPSHKIYGFFKKNRPSSYICTITEVVFISYWFF